MNRFLRLWTDNRHPAGTHAVPSQPPRAEQACPSDAITPAPTDAPCGMAQAAPDDYMTWKRYSRKMPNTGTPSQHNPMARPRLFTFLIMRDINIDISHIDTAY